DAEKENLNSALRSPRTPRHNPFNYTSPIFVEPPQSNNDKSSSRDQDSSETEVISHRKSRPGDEASQTSGGSIISESSSAGFKPVPKKRTFLSRRSSSQLESTGPGVDAQGAFSGIVPAPRRSLQRGSSGSSNQSYRNQEEMPQRSAVSVFNQVSQPSSSADETSQQPLSDVSQVFSNSSLDRDRRPPSITRDRLTTFTRGDVSPERETWQRSDDGDHQTRRELAGGETVVLHTISIQGSDREINSSEGTRPEELSFTRSIADAEPPISYDLNYIDKTDQTMKKSGQKHAFKLSTQATSPTSDEDSIAKVLDWFSRSGDSSELLSTDDRTEATKSSDKHVESKLRSEDTTETTKDALETQRGHLQRQINEGKEFRATDRAGKTELIILGKSNMGPKILIRNPITPSDEGQTLAYLSAEKEEENVDKPHTASDTPSAPGIHNGRGVYDKYERIDNRRQTQSPKRKEPVGAQFPSQEFKSSEAETYRLSAAVEKTRPAAMKPSPQDRSKSPHDRQMGTGPRAVIDSKNNPSNYTTVESKRVSKDSGREEKSSKPQSSTGKEPRPPKSRQDTFGKSSSRGSSMRRATSMFTLSAPDQKDHVQRKMDVSPVHSQSRKQRQNTEKGAMPLRLSDGFDTMTPRARAFVPRDYRHYLGMTDKNSVHTSLAPAVKSEGSEGKSGYDFDLSGPIRASTPVSSEERYGRKGSKTSQRPPWANYSSSDTGPESSMSSTSETWSRNSSNRENDDETQDPVRRALRRAEARPKNLAKSIEDMTTCSSQRQDSTADLRRISDASTIPSASSSLYADPDHLKKMSKSVPSFLQKEDADRDADSTCEDSYQRGRLMKGSSMTNLTGSSGMTSMSPLSGSVMTMYNADFGNVEVQGNIQFSINYVQKLREFHIFVAECRDLAAVDPKRGRSDPYVKSYLVPDKSNLGKRKTSVKKKTLNPTFNEILRYRVRMEYLRTQTLILSVWHNDTFGRNSFLGEVDIELSKWDFDHTQMNDSVLKPRTTPTLPPANGKGEMRLAIRFLPQVTHSEGVTKDGPNTGEVHIWVKECKNLPLIRATIDPYVKCFMLPDTSRKSRQKTRVLRRTSDPVFNHTMVYDGISETDLSDACVELTVWDRDRLASHLLGGMRLGVGSGKSYGAAVDWMDSTPYEAALWERMMASPDEWVEDILPLRMIGDRSSKLVRITQHCGTMKRYLREKRWWKRGTRPHLL
ncbi:unnamed protein product, partial [Pleuronectes platessa]